MSNGVKTALIVASGASLLFINFIGLERVWSPVPEGLNVAIRALVLVAAGWAVVRVAGRKWLHAGLIAVLLEFFDHLVLKGGTFLLLDPPELSAFYGVLISYLMVVPVSFGLGCLGGFFARVRKRRKPADSR